jgi:low affinity Fe/Cu permease
MEESSQASRPNPRSLNQPDPTAISHLFSHFATVIARRSGHVVPFVSATILVVLWMASGPVAHWSDTWQLVMNTVSSAVTFLMVFVIQGSQNRDTDLINAKLNEIIRSLPSASNEFLDLDDLSERQLQQLNAAFAHVARERAA